MSLDVTLAVYVDFDNDGSWATAGDDITAYVRDGQLTLGITEPNAHVASMGELTLLLDNKDRTFSPANSGGTYYGKLVPGLPVKVEATISGVGAVQLCRMQTVEWAPHSNRYGDRYCELICHDRIRDLLDNQRVTLPLRTDITADALIKQVLAQTYKTGAASGTATWASNSSNGDTLVIDGVTFTFVTATPASAGQVKIGTAKEDTAANLVAAVNGDVGAGSTYIAPTSAPRVTATRDGAVVTIAADARGAWGNAITLAETGTAITVSGANLTGGADAPTGATPAFDSGVQTFSYAADDWGGDLNAMTAIEQVCTSEYGFFAFDREGDPVFKNTNWLFTAANGTALDINNTQTELDARLSLDNVKNTAIVSYRPRRTLSSGTIAQASGSIEVPGLGSSGVETNRWNSYDEIPSAGYKMVTLPFIDPGTGNPMSALSVAALEPGTHYTVTDFADGSGFDYTGGGYIRATWAVNGDSIEITFSNTALGSLFIHDLYVEGVGLVAYGEQQIIRQNSTSVTAYGKRDIGHALQMGASETFAEALADYLAAVDATPRTKIHTLAFEGTLNTATTAHLLTVDLFNLLDVTEYQTAITDARFAVMGFQYGFDAESVSDITFFVKQVSDTTYWLLGETGYSELGETTVLGL